MEDQLRDCESIDRLNELLDQGLNEELTGLAFDRLVELTIAGETYTEDVPEYSTALDIKDEISSCDDFDRLNHIIESDNWHTDISGLAFQRIVELSGGLYVMENIVGAENPIQYIVEDGATNQKRPADETVDELREENFTQGEIIEDVFPDMFGG